MWTCKWILRFGDICSCIFQSAGGFDVNKFQSLIGDIPNDFEAWASLVTHIEQTYPVSCILLAVNPCVEISLVNSFSFCMYKMSASALVIFISI